MWINEANSLLRRHIHDDGDDEERLIGIHFTLPGSDADRAASDGAVAGLDLYADDDEEEKGYVERRRRFARKLDEELKRVLQSDLYNSHPAFCSLSFDCVTIDVLARLTAELNRRGDGGARRCCRIRRLEMVLYFEDMGGDRDLAVSEFLRAAFGSHPTLRTVSLLLLSSSSTKILMERLVLDASITSLRLEGIDWDGVKVAENGIRHNRTLRHLSVPWPGVASLAPVLVSHPTLRTLEVFRGYECFAWDPQRVLGGLESIHCSLCERIIFPHTLESIKWSVPYRREPEWPIKRFPTIQARIDDCLLASNVIRKIQRSAIVGRAVTDIPSRFWDLLTGSFDDQWKVDTLYALVRCNAASSFNSESVTSRIPLTKYERSNKAYCAALDLMHRLRPDVLFEKYGQMVALSALQLVKDMVDSCLLD